MKFLDLFSGHRRNFRTRIFLHFALFFMAISFAFTVFFIRHEINSTQDVFMKDGELLALVLARNARLGVFSENEEVLQDPAESVFKKAEAMSVSVWNKDGKLLKWAVRGKKAHIKDFKESEAIFWKKKYEQLKDKAIPLHIESGDVFQVFSPVDSRPLYTDNDPAALGHESGPSLIGFVEVTMDKSGLNEKTRDLLAWAAAIGMILFPLGAWTAFLLAGKITGPLKRLTGAAKALGQGETVKTVPVETADEIGRLASAFNQMVQALEKREAEKKELEAQLRHSQKMEAIGSLTGGIAHDFNNILQSIIFNIKMLKERVDPEGTEAELVDDIIESAARAISLIKSLLAFSRKQAIDPRPVDINRTVSRAARLLAPLIGGGIKLDVRQEEGPMTALLDHGQMEQILMNLAINARDAMPDGGTITITTRRKEPEFFKGRAGPEKTEAPGGGYVQLSFQDAGKGMDKETMDKAFEPFFTTKEAGKGTGLGLSIVYGIVRRHKGFIEVQSEPGQGTVFNIYFPLMEKEAAGQGLKEHPAPLRGTEGILLAEDDEKVRKVFKKILEKNGYNVMEAKDGEDAVEKFMEEDSSIQLLLFDLMMPGQSGKDAYDAIRKRRPGIKALFVSAYAGKFMREAKFAQCGVPVLSKPLCQEELLSKVREALAG